MGLTQWWGNFLVGGKSSQGFVFGRSNVFLRSKISRTHAVSPISLNWWKQTPEWNQCVKVPKQKYFYFYCDRDFPGFFFQFPVIFQFNGCLLWQVYWCHLLKKPCQQLDINSIIILCIVEDQRKIVILKVIKSRSSRIPNMLFCSKVNYSDLPPT